MKHNIFIITALLILLGAGNVPAADVDVNAQTGVEFAWWKDSEENIGYQAFIPVSVSSRIEGFSVSLLGGYGYTGLNAPNAETTTLVRPLDTKLNLSYALLDKLPFDVLCGLGFNLPTGKTNLSPQDMPLAMDPDLVSLTPLGEGFNINPTLAVARQWGRFAAGIGAGYVWRGKYDYSTRFTDYNPGDIFTATAEARYEFSPLWNGRIFGQYAGFTKDEAGDRDIYREGDFYMAGLGLQYSPSSWNAALTFKYIIRGKGELPAGLSGELSPLSDNLHGDEAAGDITLSYFLSAPATLWIKASGLLVQANDFPEASGYYIGKRLKASLELGWKRTFGDHWETNLYVRGFTMHDGDRTYPENRDERTYNGFAAGGAIIARF